MNKGSMAYIPRWSATCLVLLLFVSSYVFGQSDTVSINKDQVLLLEDSVFVPNGDTILLLPKGSYYQVLANEYAKSTQFYDSLASKAYRSKVTAELYKLLIRDSQPEEVFTNQQPVKSEEFFTAHEGKIIRHIRIHKIDIIEGDVTDTTLSAQTTVGRTANSAHTHTRDPVLLKQLLFKEGDEVNPYSLADSERILRSLPFIEDARILIAVDEVDLSVVDVILVVKDRFPWSVRLSGNSFNRFRARLTNQNVLGSGNEGRIEFLKDAGLAPINGYSVGYIVRNINKSFIDASFFIEDNFLAEGYRLEVSRNFIAPEIRYNGEFSYRRLENAQNLGFTDSLFFENFRVENEAIDTWVSRSFQLQERDNISVSARYFKSSFFNRPTVALDSNERFHNREVVLGALYYSRTNFLKTTNILSFNITEDVPVGFLNMLTFGRDWNEFEDRYYGGAEVGFAMYKNLGYLSSTLEFGQFFQANKRSNRVFRWKLGYFTPLLKVGGSFNRTYVKVDYFGSRDLSIPIVEILSQDEVRNINGLQLQGDLAISASIESILFLPWYAYGFRFAPFVFTDWGLVSERRIQEPFRNIFNNVGTGIRVRNEGLVFDTFEFSVAYFPQAPKDGDVFAFEFSFSRPILFPDPNVKKPRLVGFEQF